MIPLEQILRTSFEAGASDVHLVPGLPVQFRINTVLQPVEGFGTVEAAQTEQYVREMISPDRYEGFLEHRDVDFSAEVTGLARFRVNAHYQKGRVAIAFRAIADRVP